MLGERLVEYPAKNRCSNHSLLVLHLRLVRNYLGRSQEVNVAVMNFAVSSDDTPISIVSHHFWQPSGPYVGTS